MTNRITEQPANRCSCSEIYILTVKLNDVMEKESTVCNRTTPLTLSTVAFPGAKHTPASSRYQAELKYLA